ncbi:MAG: hypothetical protein MUE85_11285 [Microscillaceae bacterium]|jgi:hypothetical protein|nr:hypothetical protein [Microscillaceae bacterium]
MKFLLIFISNILLALNTIAQSPFLVTNFTVSGKTYNCEQRYNATRIYNQQNLSYNRTLESHPKNNCDRAKLDYPKVREVFHSVFNATRRAQFKTNDTYLGITFYIKPTTGEILEVSFMVGKNTPFTRNDIYALEQGLKGKIMPAKTFCAPMTYIIFPLVVYWE